MSFTYSSTSTTLSDLSWVRFRLSDTSSASAKFQDEEINLMLELYGNRYIAGAVLAETIGAQYAGRTDKTVGKLSISQGSLSDHYFGLAKTLRREAALHASPFAGGISQSQKDSEEQDGDRVAPGFTLDQFDNVSALTDSSTEW